MSNEPFTRNKCFVGRLEELLKDTNTATEKLKEVLTSLQNYPNQNLHDHNKELVAMLDQFADLGMYASETAGYLGAWIQEDTGGV